MKIPDTDRELRDLAGAIVAAHDRAAEIRASIKCFDAAAAEKVTALDTEIDELERRAVSCDELAIQRLSVRREVRSRTVAAIATDRKKKLAELEVEARQCFQGVQSLGEFFTTAHAQLLDSTIATLSDFYETRTRAEQAAGQTDAIRALWNFKSFIVTRTPDSAVVERLKKFADGTCPVWRV